MTTEEVERIPVGALLYMNKSYYLVFRIEKTTITLSDRTQSWQEFASMEGQWTNDGEWSSRMDASHPFWRHAVRIA